MALHLDIKKEYFNDFLKDDNKNIHAINDCADEMEEFSFTNTNSNKLFINKLTICIEDNHKFKYNKFASDIILNNGLKCYFIKDNKKTYIIGDSLPIKKNKDWFSYSCETEQPSFNNSHSFLKITFNFYKNTNNPIVLKKNDKIVFELFDNFSTLEDQTFNIEGFYIKI